MAVLGRKTEGRKGALRVLLVGEEEARRAEIKAALESLGGDPPLEIVAVTPEAANPESTNGIQPPDVTMVLFNGNEERSLSYLQKQAERSPRPALFALVREKSSGLMRQILRAGADELLFLPLEPEDATRALLKISESRRREEREQGGIICSVVSTVGGVGVSSLAANLALAMRYALSKRVALVDLDLQSGGLAVALNLEPERTIMALAEQDKKLDSIQLESALSKHPSGIYLLAAPKRIEDSELVSDVTLGAALDLMRRLFDFVVVDCGGYVNENVVAVWERSDHLFYVLDQSIGAARCCWRFIELFARLGLNGVQPHFVLSRYVPHHPISEEQITNTLGRPIYARIPRDEKALERAQLRAQDLWQCAPGSPLTRAYEDLARRLAAGDDASEESQGIMSRLLGRFGNRS
jgi:pilus assembly protein CpaE